MSSGDAPAWAPSRELWAGAFYDFANSGYTTVVLTTIYGAYFVGVVAAGPGPGTVPEAYREAHGCLRTLLTLGRTGEVSDPPSEDVTAHVIEALSLLGDAGSDEVRRGLRYLRREQRADGSWFGRGGVNYVYGTGGVLPALKAAGVGMERPRVRLATHWLLSRQNDDGGWGETCDSYDDPSLAGRGPSTASQTAWGLIALLASDGGPADGRIEDAATSGVRYLIENQEEDGQWREPQFTGTGFPGDFYINYHLYRNYWPLSALGRFREEAASLRGAS